ncbi:MAG TPA: class I SAM-dependent methyltransferase [Chthonomonadales bacterium]|nr:class I SAM-dependent methyltransferase [Chthonomonadales bacterium]
MHNKSTVEEIRKRFDKDIERFSDVKVGQATWVDSPLILELLTRCAAEVTPGARSVVDIGCGAGNYTLKLLELLPDLDVTLLDLSRPMLDRAVERVSAVTRGVVTTVQGDIRETELGEDRFDIAITGAALHHLRSEEEWRFVFAKIYRSLRAGGGFWLADYIEQSIPQVQSLMWRRWGEYLTSLKDEAYRDHVYGYVMKEDTPRDLLFQADMLRGAGFGSVDILHKSSLFGAMGAVKAA